MKTLLLIISVLFLTSCDPNSIYGIWHDTNGNGHIDQNDTIQTPAPFIFDTCQNYIPVSGNKFVCFFNNKDVYVEPVQWFYNGEPIDDMQTFLNQYGETHLYISGINKGGTIRTNKPSQEFNGKMGCIDGAGSWHMFTFAQNGLIPGGCMTFDQFFVEAQDKPNVEVISLRNTGYDCDQIIQLAEFWLADCKRCDFILYLVGNTCIPTEYQAEMKLRGATIIP